MERQQQQVDCSRRVRSQRVAVEPQQKHFDRGVVVDEGIGRGKSVDSAEGGIEIVAEQVIVVNYRFYCYSSINSPYQ